MTRRAAMMLLMTMLTTATAWAGDYTVTYSVVFGSNSITLKNGNNSAFIANSGNVWQGGTGVCVNDDYDITFTPSSNLNKTTDQITSATVFSMSSGNSFTARVASNNSYYIKQVRLINVSIPTATVTASAPNSKEITVSASGSILFSTIEVTLTDDFYGTITAYDDMTIGTAASLTDGGTNYYKSGTTITMNAPANYIVDEAKGVSNASIAADKRSYTFAMPKMNVSVGATTSEVHTISCPSGLTVTTNPYFTYNSTKYYKKGVTYTLTADADKAILSLTASGASGSSVASDKRTATVTMGSSNVTVTATFQTISGTCGTSATWSLAQDGSGNYTQLTISGTGEMTNYQNDGASIWHTTAPWGYGLTSVTIGNGVTKIGNYAFCGCQQLATATIGTSVTTIGEFAFNHCDAMTQITLPASVSSIGEQCFRNSTDLQRVDIQRTDGDLITLGSKVFNGCNALQYIVAPTPALAVQYKEATNWSDSKDKMGAEFGGFVFYATNEGGSAAYAIATADDLRNLAAAVNAGNDGSGKTFLQTAPIDLKSGGNFPTIGDGNGPGEYFSGTYDGGGNTISGLTVNISNQYAGLFGYVSEGTVKNIILVSPNVTSTVNDNICVGAIAGNCDQATIENCHAVSPTVSATGNGNKYLGALIGAFFDEGGTAKNCYYYGGNQSNALGYGEGTLTNVTSAQLLTLSDGVNIQNTMSPELGFSYDADGNGTPENYWRTGAKLTLSGLPTDDPGEGYQYVYTATAGTVSDSQYTVGNQDATLGYALLITEWTGEGNQDSPYIIQYPSQLLLLAYRVNGTHGETCQKDGYSDKYFKLGANITFSYDPDEGNEYEENYEAIGGYAYHFKGNFDGDHKTVSGIRIRKTGTGNSSSYQGLFGRTDTGANIHDVHLTDARIKGYGSIGGIVGSHLGGTVSGCTVTETAITANDYYGTIIGYKFISGTTLRNNYYHGCTMNGEAVTSGMGCKGADLTTNDGAVPMPVLSDTGSNADAIATLATRTDQGQYPVVLEGRTLSKNGEWNTLCLPFDVSDGDTEDGLTFSGTPLEGATVKELNVTTSNLNNGTLTLNFTTVKSIGAGIPCIVKWEGTSGSLTNPIFQGISVTSTEPTAVNFTGGSFVGQYSPFSIVADNIDEIILLSTGNRLGYSQNPRTLRSFRAHFEIPTSGGVREFVLNFDDENTTGIISPAEIKEITEMAGAWYSIDGRKLDAKPTKKGVYIRGGKKVIIK